MTYGEFLSLYETEIELLDVYFRNGQEVPHAKDIQDDTPIKGFDRKGGWFDVMLDCISL